MTGIAVAEIKPIYSHFTGRTRTLINSPEAHYNNCSLKLTSLRDNLRWSDSFFFPPYKKVIVSFGVGGLSNQKEASEGLVACALKSTMRRQTLSDRIKWGLPAPVMDVLSPDMLVPTVGFKGNILLHVSQWNLNAFSQMDNKKSIEWFINHSSDNNSKLILPKCFESSTEPLKHWLDFMSLQPLTHCE